MKRDFNWGILGPGNIAKRFATDLQQLTDARLVAVGSRSMEKAAAFAEQYGAQRAYGSYQELVADPDLDAIYVATPHPFHREHTLLCLDHDKAVLCEKPMGISAQQVRDVAGRARQRGVFLMEAMWTRFLPVTRQVKSWLDEGRIGEPRLLTADFGFRSGWNPQGRLLNPELAGGAILDVGVYTVAFASMVFGGSPEQIAANAHLGETGVDEQTAMLLGYPGGAMALLSCAVRTSTPQEARIMGTEGEIHIPAFWHAPSATLRITGQDPIETTGSVGYHYEAAEVAACVRAGAIESSTLSLNESIHIAQTLECVRQVVGLSYPMEAS